MLHKTRGIVLRSIKYGETSLICSVFTEMFGVQSYLVQGVRSTGKKKQSKAGLLQPTTLLDMVVYNKPQTSLQRIRDFHPAHIYQTVQEEIVKNSIALFSVELLLRLLPEQAPLPELFDSTYDYFVSLDNTELKRTGNFPVFLIAHTSNILGYSINGNYSADTPYLNLREGGFSHTPPSEPPYVSDAEAMIMDKILQSDTLADAATIVINGDTRFHLLDWLLAFLHNHTQHMGEIKSLPVLRAILH